MWYENGKKTLDWAKPICAYGSGPDEIYLLMPQITRFGGYKGYNWFKLASGQYNSHVFWETAQAAVDAYTDYEIKNVKLKVY